jgi:hypothetical protein
MKILGRCRDIPSTTIFGEVLMKILGGRQAATMKRWIYITAIKYARFIYTSIIFYLECPLNRSCTVSAQSRRNGAGTDNLVSQW